MRTAATYSLEEARSVRAPVHSVRGAWITLSTHMQTGISKEAKEIALSYNASLESRGKADAVKERKG